MEDGGRLTEVSSRVCSDPTDLGPSAAGDRFVLVVERSRTSGEVGFFADILLD